MQNELIARLANAIVEYDRARKRSEAASRRFDQLTTREEMYRLMCSVTGGNDGSLALELDKIERMTLECAEECVAMEQQTTAALQEISRIGMLADGQTLAEIDKHFRREAVEGEATRREIQRRISKSIDRSL